MATRVLGNLALLFVPATTAVKVGKAGEAIELEGDLSKALEGEKVALEAEKTTELEQSFAQAERESEQAQIALDEAKRVEGTRRAVGQTAEQTCQSNIGSSIKGYSNLADGMSPEDAARYIANNEAKFYAEFSDRAQASGLNRAQTVEAYNALRTGDYAKMSSLFDTTSPYNGAVFWSGNQEGAGQYAKSIGGTIMEQTSGGQVFNNWRGLGGMYPEWGTKTALDQKPIWKALSSQYANNASGNITYVHPSGYIGNVWEKVESPILNERMEEGLINNIEEVIVDGK